MACMGTGQRNRAAPASGRRPTGLPGEVIACLFDLDGVLTQTAKVHARAWKQMFDAYLGERSAATGVALDTFHVPRDYSEHVDGRLRQDGVRAFLASRNIVLPEGSPDDPASADSVHGLGARKNAIFRDLLHRDGVETYSGSVRFVEIVRDAGLRCAIVSASKNCADVLQAAGLDHLFEVRVDGLIAARDGLAGKPAPDMFLAAAGVLGVRPAAAAVFEDAPAGVEAGRRGGFRWVVGVARHATHRELRDSGADVVVEDLSALLEGA